MHHRQRCVHGDTFHVAHRPEHVWKIVPSSSNRAHFHHGSVRMLRPGARVRHQCRGRRHDAFIGGDDNLANGISTFLSEMQGSSKIMQDLTSSTLVILDELGRGTSTLDGYAIAYAVSRELIAPARPSLASSSPRTTTNSRTTWLATRRLESLSSRVTSASVPCARVRFA